MGAMLTGLSTSDVVYNGYNPGISSATPSFSAIYGVWETYESHYNTGDKFVVYYRYRGILKGKQANFTNWTQWYSKTVNPTPDKIRLSRDGSRYVCLTALDNVPHQTMANRTYDYIEVEYGVGVRFASPQAWNNNSDWLEPGYETYYIDYYPNYTVPSDGYFVNLDRDNFAIVLNNTSGCCRFDDRYAIISVKNSAGKNILSGNVWGTVAQTGTTTYLTIPFSALSESLVSGAKYTFQFRINQTWFPIYGELWQQKPTITETYNFTALTHTPTVQVISNTVKGLVLRLGEQNDKRYNNTSIRVSLKKSASDEININGVYNTDTAGGGVGAIITLPAQPFGTATYEIHGWSASGGLSDAVEFTNTLVGDNSNCYFDCWTYDDDGNLIQKTATIQLNPEYKIEIVPETELYKFAGRSAPSMFVGTGNTTKIEVSGVLMDDDAEDWLAIARANLPVVVRFPDGKRFRTAPDTMTTDWTFRPIKNVSYEGTVVI